MIIETLVMRQIGAYNPQSFGLLKIVGRQRESQVLIKLSFSLRGMETNRGDPHRNFVYFAHLAKMI